MTLGIAAWIITDLQRRYIGNTKILKAIVLTETIGLTVLLIPTGGISSPFIWYALNPVLVAASFLTPLFCWGALTFYLGSATLIAYRLVRHRQYRNDFRREILFLSGLFINNIACKIIFRT